MNLRQLIALDEWVYCGVYGGERSSRCSMMGCEGVKVHSVKITKGL